MAEFGNSAGFAKGIIASFIGSLGAQAAGRYLFRNFGERPGDDALAENVNSLFIDGKPGEAVEALLRARPPGEGQADKAINLSVMTTSLRAFEDGKYVAEADALAHFFASQAPEFRERFRLAWVLLDPVQRLETYLQLAQMPSDEVRLDHITAAGILDNSIAEQKLLDSNAELRSRIEQRKQEWEERRKRPWYKKLGDIFDFT